jgi:hypothetical protein
LDLTGRFERIDHAAGRATVEATLSSPSVVTHFVDPIPSSIDPGDLVQVTCRVRWAADGVFRSLTLRVDVCRDVVLLGNAP